MDYMPTKPQRQAGGPVDDFTGAHDQTATEFSKPRKEKKKKNNQLE